MVGGDEGVKEEGRGAVQLMGLIQASQGEERGKG